MKDVIYKPWVGENYKSQKNKIMILGLSHYHNPETKPDNLGDEKDLTNYIIKEYSSGVDCIEFNFLTNIMQVFTGKKKISMVNKRDMPRVFYMQEGDRFTDMVAIFSAID